MKIAHCSDLHFGRDVETLLYAFEKVLKDVSPDLVVVSGDFTQHAAHNEFIRARAFLDQLPCPFFTIPGNHDVPGFALLERFFNPYARYRRYISQELCPVLETPHAVLAGLNSARRFLLHWNWANGAISRAQLNRLEQAFARAKGRWKIAVLHHPLHAMENAPIDVHVFDTLGRLGVDVVLTGHLHRASARVIERSGHPTVYLSASTMLSTRLRDEENGFNLITLNDNQLAVIFYKYRGDAFTAEPRILYERTSGVKAL
jgi:3',5'-cyclic AMP phosphodiesterase CpdA